MSLWLRAVFALWVLTISAGVTLLTRYENAPGPVAAAPALWPRESDFPRESGARQLLVFIHPRCACTRATMRELERILARSPQRLQTRVVIQQPGDASADWCESPLVEQARSLPGVEVVHDIGGIEASRFGALTSGQALLFAASGELLFQGGITPSRAHSGDNVGRTSIVALLDEAKNVSTRATTHVFGCKLNCDARAEGMTR
ncbi:hypothetical protein Mal4_17110 [Maioricimonas rarisocia]|uniref:RedB protein n=1 Tax=Maioricimonas rarisocia TaxID=2528026 RepID=A0A517Z4J0_9PLAN|nr:RedB protein [Maioricimonas rarisocia]QDU37400.1 hypothetical protein Mal4_17110 [Maioricimonas rarisocia]